MSQHARRVRCRGLQLDILPSLICHMADREASPYGVASFQGSRCVCVEGIQPPPPPPTHTHTHTHTRWLNALVVGGASAATIRSSKWKSAMDIQCFQLRESTFNIFATSVCLCNYFLKYTFMMKCAYHCNVLVYILTKSELLVTFTPLRPVL